MMLMGVVLDLCLAGLMNMGCIGRFDQGAGSAARAGVQLIIALVQAAIVEHPVLCNVTSRCIMADACDVGNHAHSWWMPGALDVDV
jgi:hypothetical protein